MLPAIEPQSPSPQSLIIAKSYDNSCKFIKNKVKIDESTTLSFAISKKMLSNNFDKIDGKAI